MRILLANVNFPHTYMEKSRNRLFSIGLSRLSQLPPLSINLQILSSLTPDRYKADIKEYFRLGDIETNDDYDIYGLSFMTQYAPEAYRIADELRERDKKVILGGWHASALPEEAKQHADAVVIGEAEETWPKLLVDFERDKLRSFYEPERPVAPENIPILKHHGKRRYNGVMATRGCPFGCDFCSVTNSKFRNIFRPRPIKHVIEEIRSINEKYIVFHDNSLTINVEYTKQLFKELKGINKKFVASGNVNVLGRDDEFLKLASEAGFVGWFVGFESFSTQSLNEIHKKTNKVKDYKLTVKKLHDYNMHVTGSFIFGFDNDSRQTFDLAFDHIQSIEIDIPYINILTPYPGTPLFDRLEKEGRILTKDWSKYTQRDVVFQPKNMTAEELFNHTQELHDNLFSYSQILKRIIKSAKQIYFSRTVIRMNLLYRNNFKYKI